jgi:hypothetical protein
VEYPKIHSLWKRQGWFLEDGKKNHPDYQNGRQSFIVGDYACPEFAAIKQWLVQEKIDGTNIRVIYNQIPRISDHWHDQVKKLGYIPNVEFMGRTDNSDMPRKLLNHLKDTFTTDKMAEVFPDTTTASVILFGEGYGPTIQKGGGNYRKDVGFILFDVKIGEWWLQQSAVKEIAAKLNVPYAPTIGIMTEDEIVAYVKSKPLSLCSITPQVMEGIIARPDPLVLFRDGKPVMMKLKCREFKEQI